MVIRLFYGKRTIHTGNSHKLASDLLAKQTKEPLQMIHPAGTMSFGVWGYFIVERAGDEVGCVEGAHPIIDLYLYQEGE
jgi:hypothetical protein